MAKKKEKAQTKGAEAEAQQPAQTEETKVGVDEAKGESKTVVQTFKISKLSINPSRKINLGNYETVDLNAGLEIVFDKPVAFDSDAANQALEEARKFIRAEFKAQYMPYVKKDPVQK